MCVRVLIEFALKVNRLENAVHNVIQDARFRSEKVRSRERDEKMRNRLLHISLHGAIRTMYLT